MRIYKANTTSVQLISAMVLIGAFSSQSSADCGDETWLVPPSEVSGRVLEETNAVLGVNLSSSAPLVFISYFPGLGKWKPDRKIRAEEFAPVSRMPVCGELKHPLEGVRLPIIERSGEFVRIIYNARREDSAWFRANDFGSYIIDLSSIPTGTAMNAEFGARKGFEVRVYPLPEEGGFFTLLPKGLGLVRISERQGDFVRLTATRTNPITKLIEPVQVGWIRIKSEKDELLLWPWYFDDC